MTIIPGQPLGGELTPAQISSLTGAITSLWAFPLDAPLEPTCGHWPGDPYGPRRIDAVRVTSEVVPALTEVTTVRSDLALRSSDHLPVVITIDTARIARAW